MTAIKPVEPQIGTLVERPRPQHQSLQGLHAYWLTKKGPRIAPPRSVIDPADLIPLLPNIALVDVVGDQPRFRFRLFGTNLAAAHGEDLTGKYVDDVFSGTFCEEIMRQGTKLVRECCIVVAYGQYTKQADGRCLEYERIALPLSSDGRTVNMILCGFVFEKPFG